MDAPDGNDTTTIVLYRSELPGPPMIETTWSSDPLPVYQRAPHQVTAALRRNDNCGGCGNTILGELVAVVDRQERPDLWDAIVGGWFTLAACRCGYERPRDEAVLVRAGGGLTFLPETEQDPADWPDTARGLVAIVPGWALPDDPIEVRVLRRPGPGEPPELPLAAVHEGLARLDHDPMTVGEAVRLLAEALRQLPREEDPLAWARRQLRLGHMLIENGIPGSRGVRALRDAVVGFSGLDAARDELAVAQLVLGQAVLDRPHNAVVSASGAVAAFEAVAGLVDVRTPNASTLLVQARLGLARALLRRSEEGDAERSIAIFEALLSAPPRDLGLLGDSPGSLHAEIVSAHLAAGDIEAALRTLDRARAARIPPATAVTAAEEVLAKTDQTAVRSLRDAAALRVAEALLDRIPVDQEPNMERVIELVEPDLRAYPSAGDDVTTWARRHAAVGSAFGLRVRGDPVENNRRARHHLELAAGVLRDTAQDWYRRCQHQLGWAYDKSRDGEPAANLDRAIAAFRDAYVGEADIAQDLAKMLLRRGTEDDLTEAIALLEKARHQHPRTSSSFVWVQITAVLVIVLATRHHPGDRRRAIEESEQALSACAGEERLAPTWASIQVNLANLLADDPDDLDRAISALERALTVFTPQWFPPAHRGAATNLARLYERANRWPRALETWKSALDAANREYGTAVTDESRAEAVTNTTELYTAAVEACLHQIPPMKRDAFLVGEEGRSRLLRTRLGGLSVPVPPDLAEDPRIIREQQLVDDARRLRADADDPAKLDRRPQLIEALEETHAALRTLWDELARERVAGNYVALRRGDTPSWLKLTGWLAGHPRPAALLEYYTLRDRVVAFFVTSSAVQPVVLDLDVTPAAVADLANRLRREIYLHDPEWDVGESWQDAAAPLLDPVGSHLDGVEILYVIPHGPLHRVPLHAVETDGVPLLERCTVVYAPSAAAASRVRPATAGSQPVQTLVVGNPTDDLDHAEREARAVAASLGVVPLIGPEATTGHVMDALTRAESAHFACHAFYDPADPFASGIHLADGVLTARQIAATVLPTRRIVLSACESGVQAVGTGDELAGLAQALLYAGTRSLVATLWSVDDPATAEMMRGFHEMAASAGPADALRHAMLSARATGTHPHYWAPFIAYGRAA